MSPRQLLSLVSASVIAACSGDGSRSAAADGTTGEGAGHVVPDVAVSVAPLRQLVDRLAPPGSVRVTVLVPPGASPHSFEPGVATLRDATAASLLLEVGHPAFSWERTWLPSLTSDDRQAIPLAENCARLPDDPHVWLDPECLERMSERAAEGLSRLLPERAMEVDARLDSLRSDLERTKEEIAARLAPFRGRAFLVLHPAWGYFAHAFGLRQIALLSHGAEDSGAARIASIVDLARREGIHTVIVQPQYSSEAARVVASEIDGSVELLDPLGRDPLEDLRRTAAGIEEALR